MRQTHARRAPIEHELVGRHSARRGDHRIIHAIIEDEKGGADPPGPAPEGRVSTAVTTARHVQALSVQREQLHRGADPAQFDRSEGLDCDPVRDSDGLDHISRCEEGALEVPTRLLDPCRRVRRVT